MGLMDGRTEGKPIVPSGMNTGRGLKRMFSYWINLIYTINMHCYKSAFADYEDANSYYLSENKQSLSSTVLITAFFSFLFPWFTSRPRLPVSLVASTLKKNNLKTIAKP